MSKRNQSNDVPGGAIEHQGRHYLAGVASERRDAVRQVLDQDSHAWLEPRAGASHAYRLCLPSGQRLPIGASHTGGMDKNIAAAFKTDLRNQGYIIDGLASARGVQAGDEASRRVAIEQPEIPDDAEPEAALPLARRLQYREEILAALTRINVERRYATFGEIKARAARDAQVSSEARLEFDATIERELGELVRVDAVDVMHRPGGGQPLYCTPDFVPPTLEELREQEPPPPSPSTDPLLRLLAWPRETWAALERAATAIATLAHTMARTQEEQTDEHQ